MDPVSQGGVTAWIAMGRKPLLAMLALTLALAACSNDDPTGAETIAARTDEVAALQIEVLEEVPHDPGAFTQGLVFDGETLYESIGRYGASALVESGQPDPASEGVPPSSYIASRRVPVDDRYFAEGLALVDDRLIQLTWKEETAFVYDTDSLASVDEYAYEGEGWGLCFQDDEDRLVMSDGSDTLTFRDPETFEETGHVDVRVDGEPLFELNELECVGDEVYANVWMTDHIALIDPETGDVTALIDTSEAVAANEGADVLNGIAYDAATDTFLITGKLWPTMYRVRFVDSEPV